MLSVELVGFNLFGLLLENGLDQHSFVLELVTLGGKVEFVVKMTVELLGFSVFPEKSSEDSLSSDPKDLGGHSAFLSTSAFSGTSVVAFALGFKMESSSGSGVDFLFSLHDKTILDEFADENSGVSLSDLFDFVGIHPNSLSSALEDLRSKAFLTFQTHH